MLVGNGVSSAQLRHCSFRFMHSVLAAQGSIPTCGCMQNVYFRSCIMQNLPISSTGVLGCLLAEKCTSSGSGCLHTDSSKKGNINSYVHAHRLFCETSLIRRIRSFRQNYEAFRCICISTSSYTDEDGQLSMRPPSNFKWNHEISSYVRSRQGNLALCVYNRMLQESALPDKSTYTNLLSIRSSTARTLKVAKRLHSLFSSLESEVQLDVLLGNVLMSAYGRCERFECSEMVFLSMCERSVVSYNAMISLYVQQGRGQEALHLFEQVKQEGVLGNIITFVSTLHACSSESAVQFGMQLHAAVVAWDSTSDVFLNTALVSMYGKCACLDEAERLFEEMPERNVISWNTMIAAFARHGQGKRVVVLFHQLQNVSFMPTVATFVSIISTFSIPQDLLKGKQIHACVLGNILDANISIGTALIGMYRRCGSFIDARRAFDGMRVHDQGSWNAIVATYVQYNQVNEVFQLFAHMQSQGVASNKTTYSSMLSACSFKTALFEGMRIHASIMHTGSESDLLICNALVSMYGKCGVLDKAQRVFDEMKERNTVSWNAMLDAHALHGEAKSVFSLFEAMQKDQVPLDTMSFTSMLTVCSRLGLVEEARKFLISMSRDYSLVPTRDHFNCVIDLLARVGKLIEAEGLLNQMPVSHCAVSMRTLLGACRSQTDLERGERTAKQVMILDPKSTSPYTILSTLYTAVDQDAIKEVIK